MSEADTSSESPQFREPLYDIIRGVAVVLMIAAHAIFFFHTDTNELLRTIARAGNATVFTIFLFISGAVTYRAYFHSDRRGSTLRHVLGRTLIIYIGYLVVASAAVLTDARYLTLEEHLRHILLAAVLYEVPSFSEFLIPFVIFPLTIVLLPGVYKKILRAPHTWFSVAVFCFFAGVGLFILPVPDVLAPYKALLSGEEGILRFPLLQYFPVFFLGLLWGKSSFGQSVKPVIVTLYKNIFLAGSAVIGCGILGIWFSVPVINPLNRWPPSVGFLALGVFAVYLIALAVLLLPRPRFSERIWRALSYVGADSFDLYITHLLILFTYQRFVGTHYDSPVAVASMTAALFILSVFISSLNWKISPSIFVIGPLTLSNAGRYRVKKRYVAAVAVLMLLIFVQYTVSGAAVTGGSIRKGELVQPPVTVSVNRHWFVKEPGTSVPPLEIRIAGREKTDATVYAYAIPGIFLTGEIAASSAATRVQEVSLGEAPVGEYTLLVTSGEAVPGFPLFQTKLYVTEPLYVSWTLDWEGWDVPDGGLAEAEAVARDYGNLPITHFFSPRIYLSDIVSGDRAAYLTDFVRRRQKENHDEIALHLHMQFDLVKAAGVEPKTEPRWNWRSEEGYDVYLTAYSQEEIQRMLTWSLGEFASHGLPRPRGFRAGGWYANGNVLSALDALGFSYDSSGRENPRRGAFRNIPWDLNARTQPYYPSLFDQNNTGGDHFSLMEIPNNGLDTYAYTPYDLLQRFYANYSEGVLTAPRAVTFVSHPQWYTVEFPKIRSVLSAVNSLSADADHGPVVFTTQGGILNVWKSSPTY